MAKRTRPIDKNDEPPWEEDRQERRPTIEDLEAALLIDEHALEEACREQPDFFYAVAKLLALETSRRDGAAHALKDVEAVADQQIRDDAEKMVAKVTEKEVESLKRTDPNVLAARNKLMELERRVGTLTALKEAWTQRNYMLRQLVDLHTAAYYGDVQQRSQHVGDNKAAIRDRYQRERKL